MIDLASLVLAVDATQPKQAVSELDKLTAAGARAEKAVDGLGREAEQSGKQIKTASMAAAEMAAAAQRSAATATGAAKNMQGMGASGKLAAYQMQNLSFQLNDVIIGLTSGQKPMTVFMQQGSQIAQIMGQAGVGIGGMVAQVGKMIGSFLIAHPLLLAASVAAGLATAAFGLMADEINKNSKVHVTWKDTALGAYDVISDYLSNKLTAAFAYFGTTTGDVWEKVKLYTKNAINFVIGAVDVVPKVIAATYDKIPAAFGDAFYSAANLAIAALNKMVQMAAAPINLLVDGLNMAFGTKLPHIVLGSVAALENPYAGAMSRLGNAAATAFTSAFKTDYIGGFADAVSGAAQKRAMDRLAEENKKGGAKAGKAGGDAAGEAYQKAMLKWVEETAQDLVNMTAKLMVDAGKQATLDFKWDSAHIFDDQREAAAKAGEAVHDYRVKQAAFNDELERLKELAGSIDLGEVFGRGGSAIESMSKSMDRLAESQTQYLLAMQRAEELTGDDKIKARTKAERAYSDAKLHGTVAILGATKNLFNEQSAGYKAIEIAEKAAAAVAAVRTGIHVAQGAAKIFASLGPWAFPVVAAMMGVMAGLGFSGGGGSASPNIPTAEQMQASQGTGTVLGDSSAKSQSIGNSLELMLANTNKDLEFSSAQVNYLRSINDGIAGLTNALARQLGLGSSGAFSTTSLGLGSTGSSGILGALFGSTTTRTLVDQGVKIFTGVLAEVASGVSAAAYNVVKETTTKKFLGVTVSSKSSYTTTENPLDAGVERQIGLVFANIRDSVIGAAKTFGLDVTDYVNAINTEITISLQGLKGDEIGAEIEAVFSAFADKLAWQAGQVGLSLEEFQQAGEGLYQTLMRVVKNFTSVQVALSSIGQSFSILADVSGNGFSNKIAGSENLISLFGGLDSFIESIGSYQDKFLTEAERMAPVIEAVQREMNNLGLASVTTNDQFKAVVQGLNLNTTAGQELFARLLTVAPAFAKVTEYLGGLDEAMVATGKSAAELAAIAKDRRALEIELMTAMGDTAGALAAQRADQLAAMDESNRAIRQQIWVLNDAAEAEKVLADARAEATAYALSVAKERRALEIEYLEATGHAQEALNARRMDEVATLDASLLGLKFNIWALQDSAAAAKEAADAEKARSDAAAAAAAEAQRVADELLAQAKTIADQRRSIEIELMEALGNASGALAARRADELAALDASNRAIKQQVYDAQDAATAAQALAEATRAQAEAAKQTEDAIAQALARQLELDKTARSMTADLLDLQGNAAGALAIRRQLELEAMDASLRPLKELIYQLTDAKTAAEALAAAQAEAAKVAKDAADESARTAKELADRLAAIAQERASLEIRYLEAIGDTAGATAMKRAQELAATDDSNRALLQMIYTAEDAAAAIGGVSNALDILKEAADLQIRLLEAQGNTAAATALKRQAEIAATAEANRALLLQIYATEDAAAAAKSLADAQAEAARIAADAQAEAQRLANEQAQAAAALAEKRAGLEIELMRALGNESAALAAQRQLELAALDPSLVALQQQVWAAQDATAANAELAQHQADAADAAKVLSDATNDMTLRLLDAQGRTAEATAMRRALEMAATDASLRGMLAQVYAAEDATAAQEAYTAALEETTSRIADARSALSDAYDREAGAIKDVHDRFAGFAATLREFRNSLGSDAAFGNTYRNAQVAFIKASALAGTGNEAGLAGLPDAARAFLDASKSSASSLTQYQRDVAAVARALDTAIGAADAAVDYQSLQLAALDRSVAGLIEVNQSVLSVHDAIAALESALTGEAAPAIPVAIVPVSGGSIVSSDTVTQSNADLRSEMAAMRADLNAALLAIAQNTGDSARLQKRWDRGNAMAITADADQPVPTEVTA
jgi:hypothetical protein